MKKIMVLIILITSIWGCSPQWEQKVTYQKDENKAWSKHGKYPKMYDYANNRYKDSTGWHPIK